MNYKKYILSFLLSMTIGVTSITSIYTQELTHQEVQLIVQNINVDFSLFPTQNIWNEVFHSPLINTRFKRDHEELLITESGKEPNFDGRFRIVKISYPAIRWYDFFMIDLNTGLVYERIFRTGFSVKPGLSFNAESSMLILTKKDSRECNETPDRITYLRWNGQDFNVLLAINTFFHPWR